MVNSAALTVFQPELFAVLEHCSKLATKHMRTIQGEENALGSNLSLSCLPGSISNLRCLLDLTHMQLKIHAALVVEMRLCGVYGR